MSSKEMNQWNSNRNKPNTQWKTSNSKGDVWGDF